MIWKSGDWKMQRPINVRKVAYACLYLCGGDVADVFLCQLFQQSGLAGVVQAKQEQAHLPLRRPLQPAEYGQQALQLDQGAY